MDTKIETLHQIFDKMSYGENLEDTTEASEWLQSTEIQDKSNDVDDVLKGIKQSTEKVQKQHLIRLAQEIRGKSNVIAQIEIIQRGVLSKDTKKSTDIIAQYLFYYANFIKRSNEKDKKGESKGLNVAVFEDDSPLWLLALAIIPSIVSGYTILIQTGIKFARVVKYILELAKKVGIPEEFFVLVPSCNCSVSSNDTELQLYLNNERVGIIILFLDLLNPKYKGVNKLNKKILVFSSYKTSVIVFDDADTDSAVENIIEAAWGYQGMNPWSVDTVIIQENVFNKVEVKLRRKLEILKIGYGNDRNADISYPTNSKIFKNLTKQVNKAKSLGITVYQKEISTNSDFTPTLIIGSKVSTNNVIETLENSSAVTLVPFRFIDEAVNLANNSRQGLGVSVWCENIGLVNEVARKLNVNNVWINSHGLLSPEVPLIPFKDSGLGFFGSKFGIAEYARISPPIQRGPFELPDTYKNVEVVKNAINLGKRASSIWNKMTFLEKSLVFLQIEKLIDENKSKIISKVPDAWLVNLLQTIEGGVSVIPGIGGTLSINGFNVTSSKEPKGVLVIETRTDIDTHCWKLIIAALLEGNSVILLNESAATVSLYQDISKQFPAGVLSVLPYSLDAVKTCSLHKELDGYFSNESNIIFSLLPLSESKIFGFTSDDWEDNFRKVILVKNVWSNIGLSFQCNL